MFRNVMFCPGYYSSWFMLSKLEELNLYCSSHLYVCQRSCPNHVRQVLTEAVFRPALQAVFSQRNELMSNRNMSNVKIVQLTSFVHFLFYYKAIYFPYPYGHFYIRFFDNLADFRRPMVKCSSCFSVAFTEHKQLDMRPMNDLGLFSTSVMIRQKSIVYQCFFFFSVSP